MKYSVYGYINNDLILESSIEAKHSNIVFHSLMGMVDCVKEDAYDYGYAWEVAIRAYDSKSIAYKSIRFYGSDPWDYWTEIGEDTVHGQGCDEELSMWLNK